MQQDDQTALVTANRSHGQPGGAHLAADSCSDGAGRIPVLIVEGDARVRRGIRSIVESFPRLELIGEWTHVQKALESVPDAPTTVVIMNVEPFTPAECLQGVGHLIQKGCSVVAMSTRSGLRAAALAAGAVAFVEMDERGAASLVDALREAAGEIHPS